MRALAPHVFVLGVCLLTVARVRSAHAAGGGDQAAAEALFEEAQKLVREKNYAEACPKFEESNRLDRGAGTLIHLADCYEKNNQTASAWVTYKEAASASQALGRRDWEKLARQRSSALEPKMARLTIKVVAPVDKLEVTKDGAPFAPAAWGVSLPVDVGSHAIEASAPGYKPFHTVASVSNDGDRVEVVVPKLEAEGNGPVASNAGATALAPPVSAEPGQPRSAGALRTVGFVVAGIGVAGIAVGGVTGVMAIGKNNDAKDKCPVSGGCASQEGVDATASARSLALVSTIAFAAGAALAVGGAVLVFTARKGDDKTAARTVRVTPAIAATGGGLALGGVF